MVLDPPHVRETAICCSWVCLTPDCDYLAWLVRDMKFDPELFGQDGLINDPEGP